MAKADINLTLRNGVEAFGSMSFKPVDMLQGTVIIYPDGEFNCKHLFVRLEWHTEGRGTQYREKVAELDLFQGLFQDSMPKSFDFEFQLPEEPWCYEGFYVNVVWGVTVQLDVPWTKDLRQEELFILAPDREAVVGDG
jgi:hypothetical protein